MPFTNLHAFPINSGYWGNPDQQEFTSVMPFSHSNVTDSNFNNADMTEWDQWLRWDGTQDVVDPSLVQKPDTRDIQLGDQQWQNGVVDQSSLLMFDSMDVQDGSFELDTPSLSPITATEGSIKSSASSPMDMNGQDFDMIPRSAFNRTDSSSTGVSSEVTSSTPLKTPAKPTRGRGKRRKATTGGEPDLTQSRKRGHNAIEKRYRTNLNDKIVALKDSIPSLRTSAGDEVFEDDEEGREGAQKFGKAAILTRAVEYIAHLEESTKRLGAETNALQVRVSAFEKLARTRTDETRTPSYSLFKPSQTLESIQADFLQGKTEKEKKADVPAKRRDSRKMSAL